MAATTRLESSFIAPERLYTLRGFQIDSGVSATRIREARREGVRLNVLSIGRRKYVRGRDAIEYLEKLAAFEAAQPAAETAN